MWVRTLRLFPFVCTGRVRVITWSLPGNLTMPTTCTFESLSGSTLPDILGRESNFGVALAFQDFLVHFVVATRIFGVSAGSIHDYRPPAAPLDGLK
jgi:hypothetical protein